MVGHALEHQRGGAVGQRAVDDVAVAGHPAHVGGAPVDVVFLEVEHRLLGVGAAHQVAAGGVQQALRFAAGTGGVEDEQRGVRVNGIGRASGGERVVAYVYIQVGAGQL